ncbi:hypothetical protein [Xanthobacter aminoxidans]|uniref:hypothetical protein n=1 Tax=Xanthobacter aminoxidans TaxID=186280 RepID=UPI00372A745A
MPFLEINDFSKDLSVRSRVVAKATAAVCDVYAVSEEIVSVYFIGFDQNSYGHAGKFPADADKMRIFIKLHAYPRGWDLRKELAQRLTTEVSALYGVPASKVAIYFFDRNPNEVSHGGALQGGA